LVWLDEHWTNLYNGSVILAVDCSSFRFVRFNTVEPQLRDPASSMFGSIFKTLFCPKNQIGNFLPKTFQIAPSCPKNDNTDIGRLFIIPWRSKIAPWMAIITYLDATYPPPFFPPVLRRMMTWMSCASEKSTLVVPAHWKWKAIQSYIFILIIGNLHPAQVWPCSENGRYWILEHVTFQQYQANNIEPAGKAKKCDSASDKWI